MFQTIQRIVILFIIYWSIALLKYLLSGTRSIAPCVRSISFGGTLSLLKINEFLVNTINNQYDNYVNIHSYTSVDRVYIIVFDDASYMSVCGSLLTAYSIKPIMS